MEITKSVVSQRDRALVGGDYQTYHVQITRRIHTIRKRLGITTPKGRKYSAKAAVTSQDVSKNSEWVQLLLASAERAWADAMHMKSSQSPENTQRPLSGATKSQIISRFRRAIQFAVTLVEALQDQSISGASNQDVLEAKAYVALLRGGLDFERNKWSSCIGNYSFVRLVYTALTNQSQSDTYRDLLEGTVDPSIRYAAYQEKLPRTKAISDIAIEHFPTTETTSRGDIEKADAKAFETSAERVAAQSQGLTNLPTTISWRGRQVKLEDASISQALASANAKQEDLEANFSSAKDLAAAYDDIINARQDAADATKTAIDELIAEGVDQGDSRIQSLQVTRTAVNYSVIEWRVGRNRVLCGSDDGLTFEPSKPKSAPKPRKDGSNKVVKEEPTGRRVARLRERAALYDSILQNLDAVKQLPGVIADESFVTELDAKRAYFQSLKSLAIGRSHAVNGHIVNALALFAKANELSQQASASSSSSGSIPRLDVSGQQLEALQKHLSSLTLQYQALADLQKHSSSVSTQSKQYAAPLIERLHLNQYDDQVDLNNIVNYPPKLQPVPMKPLFFDLAWEYIQYPNQGQSIVESAVKTVVHEVEKVVKPEESAKKKGWFGFGR